jgi:MFS family permease
MVELPYLGSRGTLFISTGAFHIYMNHAPSITFLAVLTGVFILASTTSRSSNTLLGWNCAYSFVSNIMYGVLYALSPEVFPTKDRGTGNALVASANRIFGIMVNGVSNLF